MKLWDTAVLFWLLRATKRNNRYNIFDYESAISFNNNCTDTFHLPHLILIIWNIWYKFTSILLHCSNIWMKGWEEYFAYPVQPLLFKLWKSFWCLFRHFYRLLGFHHVILKSLCQSFTHTVQCRRVLLLLRFLSIGNPLNVLLFIFCNILGILLYLIDRVVANSLFSGL